MAVPDRKAAVDVGHSDHFLAKDGCGGFEQKSDMIVLTVSFKHSGSISFAPSIIMFCPYPVKLKQAGRACLCQLELSAEAAGGTLMAPESELTTPFELAIWESQRIVFKLASSVNRVYISGLLPSVVSVEYL